MQRAGLPIVCLEALHTRASLAAQRNKTDRNDALGIAQLLRSGWCKTVHVKSDQAHRMRLLLAHRRALKRKAVDIENALLAEFNAMHKLVERLAVHDPVCRRFMTVPGVGPVTALAFKSSVDDPTRFRRSRTLGAHFGLTPQRYQSGAIDIQGSISKRGDGEVRVLLFEAARSMMIRSKLNSSLKSWGLRLAKKRGMKRAAIAVARKLAAILHRMWLDGSEFRFTRQAEATPA